MEFKLKSLYSSNEHSSLILVSIIGAKPNRGIRLQGEEREFQTGSRLCEDNAEQTGSHGYFRILEANQISGSECLNKPILRKKFSRVNRVARLRRICERKAPKPRPILSLYRSEVFIIETDSLDSVFRSISRPRTITGVGTTKPFAVITGTRVYDRAIRARKSHADFCRVSPLKVNGKATLGNISQCIRPAGLGVSDR